MLGDTPDPANVSDRAEPDSTERSAHEWREGLVLRDWQIAFGYASHFTDSLPALESVAPNLVRHGVAECAFLSDGEAWWPSVSSVDAPYIGRPRRIEHGAVELRMSSDLRSAEIKFDKVPEGFPLEALGQSASLRYQELSVFGPRDIPPRYVRAYLGKCCFVDGASMLQVYPQLKIFENGVVLVYFRMLSPESPQALNLFLRKYVNAPLTTFRKVLVPPGIAYWAPLAAPLDGIFRLTQRLKTARDQYHHRTVVSEAISITQDSAFSFPLVSLSAPRERAILSASEAAIKDSADEVVAAAKREVGLGDDALERVDAFERALSVARLPGEALETVAERLQENLNATVISKAEAVGERVVQQAIRMLGEQKETLSGLALTLMAVAGLVAGSRRGPPSLFKIALMGRGKVNSIGNHWSGHHHVHLIRFRNQGETASDNENAYRGALASIIARTKLIDEGVVRSMLPKSSRLFDDVGVYLAINGSLWVQSRRSLKTNKEFADPNKDHLVDEQQAKAELLDYAYALHRRIADSATMRTAGLEDLLAAQRDLADFELSIHDASHFGEIRDLVEKGLEAYEIGKFRTRVSEFIRVREAISIQESVKRTGRYTTVLSVLAGVLAVPSLGRAVVMPIWLLLDLPTPAREELRDLLYIGIATAIVAFALVMGRVWASQSKATTSPGRVRRPHRL